LQEGDYVIEKNIKELGQRLKNFNKVLVLYSGGVDSGVLLKIANDFTNTIALTVVHEATVDSSIRRAKHFCSVHGIKHLIVNISVLKNPYFVRNDKMRCYYCKKAVHRIAKQTAQKFGCNAIVDGVVADDFADDRPGLTAAREDGILHPLYEYGITKRDVYMIAEQLGVTPTPPQSCYATRIAYGIEINSAILSRVRSAEEKMIEEFGEPIRVRYFGEYVMVEGGKKQIEGMRKNENIVREILDYTFPECSRVIINPVPYKGW